MQVYADLAALQAARTPTAVAVGIFDGVHLGHRRLLAHALELARAQGLRALVCTFYPHPVTVLRPDSKLQLIEPLQRRLRRFAELGVDATWVQSFDPEFAAQSPQNFVHNMLVGDLQARHVVVGSGFSFGRAQGGNVALLQELTEAHGCKVHALPLVHLGGHKVSSSLVRTCIASGDVVAARRYLGRPYMLEGLVMQGEQRGRSLGFGTANVEADNALRPCGGVYAGQAQGAFGVRTCVVNIGVAPTFAGTRTTRIEAHLLGYTGAPLYDTHVEVELWQRLRDEQKFASPEQLRTQIAADVAATQRIMAATAAQSLS